VVIRSQLNRMRAHPAGAPTRPDMVEVHREIGA
jgi:hypothetical protein